MNSEITESFKVRLDHIGKVTIESLEKIWSETGYQRGECTRLSNSLLEKLNEVCLAEIANEQQILEHARQEVYAKSEQYIDLSAQLGRSKIDIGSILSRFHNYSDKLAELKKLISKVSEEISQRQGLIDSEVQLVKTLQVQLGECTDLSTLAIQSNGSAVLLLSDSYLSILKSFKAKLEKEKERRLVQMKALVQDCYALIKELDIFEEMAMQTAPFQLLHAIKDYLNHPTHWPLGYSLQDIANLQQEYALLVQEKDDRRQELSKTGAIIVRLWALLRIPKAECEAFSKSFQLNMSLDTVHKGQNECIRLQSIRQTSLARIVGQIRDEIMAGWIELGMDQMAEQRNEFPEFFTSTDCLADDSVC